MDSQQTASNAAETPSDRGVNVVKSNPPLPPGFRARPQGPPGIPRHPINNGPIGQPRPGGQPQQIRFENRPPIGPSNSGQFIQLRAHGSPRPPGGSFPQRPPHQGHNPPIILNPRFPSSPVQRPGPQQGPRQFHPGNYQALGTPPRAQSPNPNIHQQQARRPETVARSPEITQKQLLRNESSLNVSQQSSPFRKEDQRPTPPRIVIEKMADVDNSRKLRQCENAASIEKAAFRENADNDDDDDVVMDGKSPRANGDATNQGEGKDVQMTKRPETATINGKVYDKSDDGVQQIAGKPDDTATSVKSEKTAVESGTMEADGRLCSISSNENTLKRDTNKTDGKPGELIKKEVGGQVTTPKENFNEKSVTKSKLQTVSNESDGGSTEQSSKLVNVASADKNKEKLHESTEKSRATAPTNVATHEPERTVPSKPPNSPRASSLVDATRCQSEQKPETLISPQRLQDSTDQSKDETDEASHRTTRNLKESSMSPGKPVAGSDKSREVTSGEVNQEQSKKSSDMSPKSAKISHETASSVIDKNRNEDELTVDTRRLDKVEAGTPSEKARDDQETRKPRDELESKTPETKLLTETKSTGDSSKEIAEEAKVQETRGLSIKSEEHATPVQMNESQTVLESNESSKSLEKSKVGDGKVNERTQPDVVSKSSNVSTCLADESRTTNLSENRSSDKLTGESLEAKATVASSASEQKESKTRKPPMLLENGGKFKERTLSPSKSPEEGVKGFDNGQQRSLSVKSPHSRSPRSPVSPKSLKSPMDDKKKTPELKISSRTPKVRRVPSPAALDEKSEKKFSTAPEIENGGVRNESVQSNAQPTTNGVADSPTKKSPSKGKDADKRSTAGSPVKSPSKSVKSLPRTPETPTSTAAQEKKKLPMNKIQVGSAPSPNLKTVRSKIGSLDNASYKPGGGKVKIENRKLDFSKAQPKIAAKNEKYTPSGGDKKISQVKLQWNAKSKVGSLDNATYKPGGGDKKIETVKLDFKDKAKPKVGSKDNAKHVPGGGSVKSSATPPKTPQDTNNDIQTQKIDIQAESKVGSMDNMTHKPGGGDKKIFNDTEYLRQTGSNVESLSGSGSQITSTEDTNSSMEQRKDNLPQPPPTTPTKTQILQSRSSMVTPKAVRSSLAKSPEAAGSRKASKSFETVEVENENKKNLSKTDYTLTKDKTAKPPTSPDSPYKHQLKNPNDKITKSRVPSNPSNNPELTKAENKAIKSPKSVRSPNTPRLKSPDKSSTEMSGKASPKELRLPKLAPSPTPLEMTRMPNTHAKINLPKLIEHVAH